MVNQRLSDRDTQRPTAVHSSRGLMRPDNVELNPCTPPVDPFDLRGLWFVLHTKSRQEKAIAEFLDAARIAYFLPLRPQVRFHGKRKFTANLPLFPSYVFLRGSVEDAYTVDRTKRLAGIIKVADQDRLDWELRNLHLAIDSHVSLDPFPYLKTGIRAEMRSGPLKGLQGIIESRTRCDRLILQVDMLGRAVGVEVDGSLLEPLE